VKDNRIPPYGMKYDEARKRNALPVPASQYGSPAAGGTFNYWDEVALNPPGGAASATISLLYQPTSWEYVQFLHLANNKILAFLANEGVNLLNAWLNTGMAAPHTLATTTWTGSAPCVAPDAVNSAKIAKLSVTTVRVTWNAVPNATKYQVWWHATSPYFMPGATCTAGNGCSEVTGTSFDHASLGSTASNTSYLVQPVAGCGAVQATPSNRVGEFEYGLVKGQ
jgi:hypothetical protein